MEIENVRRIDLPDVLQTAPVVDDDRIAPPLRIARLDQEAEHFQPIAQVLNPQTFGRRAGLRPVVFSLRVEAPGEGRLFLERGELTRRLRGDRGRGRDLRAIVREGVHESGQQRGKQDTGECSHGLRSSKRRSVPQQRILG
jgi:hypothetical protein